MYMVHQLPASHNQHLCFLKANTQTKEKKNTFLKKNIIPVSGEDANQNPEYQ